MANSRPGLRRSGLLIAVAALVALIGVGLFALWYVGDHLRKGPFRHRSSDPYAAQTVRTAQGITIHDVEKVELIVSDFPLCVLRPDTDRPEIERLLRAVQRIRVSEWEVWVNCGDQLYIHTTPDWRGVRLYANFDPARAPVISPAMRSDDLARIVQDIVSRKGRRHAVGGEGSNP